MKGVGWAGIMGVLVAAVVGWVANIVKLVGLIGDPVSGELVIRAIGVFFAPLGAILGFL
jgi:hypothetical protein